MKNNINNEKIIGSDGMGTFVYARKCEEDGSYIVLRVEEEDGKDGYRHIEFELHKNEVKEIINGLIELL